MARHAGIGTYIRQLVPRVVRALPDWQFTVITPPREDLGAWSEAPAWTDRVHHAAARSDIYSLRQHWEVAAAARTTRPDLWWVPHYDVPMRLGAPFVSTVHDVAHLALESTYGGPVRTRYARAMFRRVRHRARHVIFVSRFTESEFLRYVGPPAGEHSVIYNGVDDAWAAIDPESGRPHARPYLLFVGSAKPHKNLASLVAAFARVAAATPHDLVIVGATSGMRTTAPVAAHVPPSITDRVTLTGPVDGALLRRYVAHAAALVFPSLYEGFGLPALEAMMAGCPCVVSSAASLPEVCGPAAAYCDPNDPDDIALQIRRVLDDRVLRDRLIDAGRARARGFRWETAAASTAAVLSRALAPASVSD